MLKRASISSFAIALLSACVQPSSGPVVEPAPLKPGFLSDYVSFATVSAQICAGQGFNAAGGSSLEVSAKLNGVIADILSQNNNLDASVRSTLDTALDKFFEEVSEVDRGKFLLGYHPCVDKIPTLIEYNTLDLERRKQQHRQNIELLELQARIAKTSALPPTGISCTYHTPVDTAACWGNVIPNAEYGAVLDSSEQIIKQNISMADCQQLIEKTEGAKCGYFSKGPKGACTAYDSTIRVASPQILGLNGKITYAMDCRLVGP